MPRPTKGARLYLRKRRGREPVWVIRDGAHEEVTGCGPSEHAEAEKRLAEFINEKHQPRSGEGDPRKVLVSDVLNIYSQTIEASTRVKRKCCLTHQAADPHDKEEGQSQAQGVGEHRPPRAGDAEAAVNNYRSSRCQRRAPRVSAGWSGRKRPTCGTISRPRSGCAALRSRGASGTPAVPTFVRRRWPPVPRRLICPSPAKP
jgi:hypothetical protein